jgi:hypothetical protein
LAVVFRAWAYNWVVCDKVGENDVTPVPPLTIEPPHGTSYQSIVHPLGVVALNVTGPAPQRELLLGLVGAAGGIQVNVPGAPVASVNDVNV